MNSILDNFGNENKLLFPEEPYNLVNQIYLKDLKQIIVMYSKDSEQCLKFYPNLGIANIR